ncbi:MAG: lipid-A-disaccharide synthase [Rickettsiaceae bacterium]|nr:lipid-A-disaccharide synthase [Rickettsiaceae bacterium]
MKKIYIIAGEKSGDKIGASIIKELNKQYGGLSFAGVGGSAMNEMGLTSLFPIEQISLIGFIEIIPHIFRLRRLINDTVIHIQEFKPDLVITIDSPGFSTRVVQKAKEIIRSKFVHVVAPTVWAYKPSRAKKFARLYDLMLTLLPFEPPYFEQEGLKTIFIGHFIHEQTISKDPKIFREKYCIRPEEKLLTLLPGSREGEVKMHMPIFIKTIKLLRKKMNIKVVILASSEAIQKLISSYRQEEDLFDTIVVEDEASSLYAASNVALAKSGTNNLEILMHDLPLVICYKINFISWIYIKLYILVKFANLVNIMSKRMIIPEFIQSDCTPEKLSDAIEDLLTSPNKASMQVQEAKIFLDQMKNTEGFPGALAARAINELLSLDAEK